MANDPSVCFFQSIRHSMHPHVASTVHYALYSTKTRSSLGPEALTLLQSLTMGSKKTKQKRRSGRLAMQAF